MLQNFRSVFKGSGSPHQPSSHTTPPKSGCRPAGWPPSTTLLPVGHLCTNCLLQLSVTRADRLEAAVEFLGLHFSTVGPPGSPSHQSATVSLCQRSQGLQQPSAQRMATGGARGNKAAIQMPEDFKTINTKHLFCCFCIFVNTHPDIFWAQVYVDLQGDLEKKCIFQLCFGKMVQETSR